MEQSRRKVFIRIKCEGKESGNAKPIGIKNFLIPPNVHTFSQLFSYLVTRDSKYLVRIHALSEDEKVLIHAYVHKDQRISQLLKRYKLLKITFITRNKVEVRAQTADAESDQELSTDQERKVEKIKKIDDDNEKKVVEEEHHETDNSNDEESFISFEITIIGEDGKKKSMVNKFKNLNFNIWNLRDKLIYKKAYFSKVNAIIQSSNGVEKKIELRKETNLSRQIGNNKLQEIIFILKDSSTIPDLPEYKGVLDLKELEDRVDVAVSSPKNKKKDDSDESEEESSDSDVDHTKGKNKKSHSGKSKSITEYIEVDADGLFKSIELGLNYLDEYIEDFSDFFVPKKIDTKNGASESRILSVLEANYEDNTDYIFNAGSNFYDSMFQLVLSMRKFINNISQKRIKVASSDPNNSKPFKRLMELFFGILSKPTKKHGILCTMGFEKMFSSLLNSIRGKEVLNFFQVGYSVFSFLDNISSLVTSENLLAINYNETIYYEAAKKKINASANTMILTMKYSLVDINYIYVTRSNIFSGSLTSEKNTTFRKLCFLLLSNLGRSADTMLAAYKTNGIFVMSGKNIIGVKEGINVSDFELIYRDDYITIDNGTEFVFYEENLNPNDSSTRVYPFAYVRDKGNNITLSPNDYIYPNNISFPVIVVANSGRFNKDNFTLYDRPIGVRHGDFELHNNDDQGGTTRFLKTTGGDKTIHQISWGWFSSKHGSKIDDQINVFPIKVEGEFKLGPLNRIEYRQDNIYRWGKQISGNKIYDYAIDSWFNQNYGRHYYIKSIGCGHGINKMPQYLLITLLYPKDHPKEILDTGVPKKLSFGKYLASKCDYNLKGIIDCKENDFFETHIIPNVDKIVFTYNNKGEYSQHQSEKQEYKKPLVILYVKI